MSVVSKIEVSESGVSPINYEFISGWEQLSQSKQVFLKYYALNNLAIVRSAMESGITTNMVNEWMQDKVFVEVMNTIKLVVAEELQSKHLDDAVNNAKVRGQVLQVMHNDWKPKKTVTHQIQSGGLHHLLGD